jgi:hypothetical protein
LFSLLGNSQSIQKKDTIKITKTYGLRIGLDLSNPIRTSLNKDRKAFEITLDFRIKPNLYIASEIGQLDQFTKEVKYDFNTKGQYLKLGANYNVYKNWLNMDNEIYVGIRYGHSIFTQSVSNIVINTENSLPPLSLPETQTFDNLNANWLEFVVGIKAEIYKNIYLGFQFSGNKILSQKKPKSFQNLYVPGFNRVFLNKSGFGFNYTISYRIPILKK